MKHEITRLMTKYRDTGLLVDANLLLVYLIGSINIKLIETFDRTHDKYTKEDYEILHNFLNSFNRVVTTPNILTEVNNLTTRLQGVYKPTFYRNFRDLIEKFDETYFQSVNVVKSNEFNQLGITDAGILSNAVNKFLLLTDDFPLYNRFASNSGDVINFHHLRTYLWSA